MLACLQYGANPALAPAESAGFLKSEVHLLDGNLVNGCEVLPVSGSIQPRSTANVPIEPLLSITRYQPVEPAAGCNQILKYQYFFTSKPWACVRHYSKLARYHEH